MNYLKITAAILLIGITYSFAQSFETKEKINNLKGDVTKITVETTEGKVELTGEDAEVVFNRLKSSKNKNVVFIHNGPDENFEKEITINVDVDDMDGEKVVVIKKNVDGKEIIEEYKGEEAEKFMQEHGEKHHMKFISEDGDVHVIINGDDDKLIWESEDCDDSIRKEINVEVKDGVKEVTVTTNKDGKEEVEVYKGEEAEKFLEEMDHGNEKVFIDNDGNKTIKKKKIIIKEINDDDHENDKDHN